MSARADRGRPAPWSAEAGARRLHARVRGACAGATDLPTRLEAGLRAALEMLAADPDLAYTLTVEPYLDDETAALDALRGWLGRLGALLRGAAESDPRASSVELSFLAPFLIGGVRFQIARLVLDGEGSDLLRILPGTLEALLACYLGPDDPRRHARATLDG